MFNYTFQKNVIRSFQNLKKDIKEIQKEISDLRSKNDFLMQKISYMETVNERPFELKKPDLMIMTRKG